jgi:hypothetical protein
MRAAITLSPFSECARYLGACHCVISPSVVYSSARHFVPRHLALALVAVFLLPSPRAPLLSHPFPSSSSVLAVGRHSRHSIPHRTGITPRPTIPPVASLIFLSSPAPLDPHPVLNLLCCTVEAALFTLCRSSAFVSLTHIKS